MDMRLSPDMVPFARPPMLTNDARKGDVGGVSSGVESALKAEEMEDVREDESPY